MTPVEIMELAIWRLKSKLGTLDNIHPMNLARDIYNALADNEYFEPIED